MVAFSKRLKPTDVGSRFSWPTSRLDLLPPFAGGARQVQFPALDAHSKVWTFTCSKRRQGPYLKPVLDASSWLPFVQEKGLSVNDLVVFYYDRDQPIRFSIRARKLKTIKLLGRHFTAYANEE